MYALGVKLGFGFSAGFIDYALNYPLSTKPLLLIPVGLVFAVVYYVLFRVLIVKLNLKTPGREDDVQVADEAIEGGAADAGVAASDSKAARVLANIGARTTSRVSMHALPVCVLSSKTSRSSTIKD